MNPFDPEVQALAWTLIHFLWQGCGVWAVAALALRALRGSRPGARYAVGILALVACVAIPVGTYARLHPAAMAREVEGVVIAKAEHPESAPSPTAREGSPIRGHHVPMLHVEPKAWLPWVVRLWFFGSLLLALRLGGGWMGLRSLRRDGKPASEEWQRRLERLGRAMRIGRVPILRLSTSIKSPLVAGWIRPMLLMPAGLLTGLDPAAVEALLAHELAHIRRQDYLVNLMQCAVEILLFYHPAVWWISARVRTERELCCDDAAVAWCHDPQLYAETLNELRAFQARSLAPALAAGGGDLMFRIKRLLLPTIVQNTRRINLTALVCSAALLLGAGFTTRMLHAESASNSGFAAWFLAGSNTKDYQLSEDAQITFNGKPSLKLSSDCVQPEKDRFGTAMQNRLPDGFQGKRVRFSAWIRAEDVKDWAGLWMRVDGQEHTAPLGLDNMLDRPIRGTQEWKRSDVVLDVPAGAKNIAYGVLLNGNGRIWMADPRMEITDAATPVTGMPYRTAPSVFDPANWRLIGTQPKLYSLRQDLENAFQGSPSILVESTGDAIEDFGGFNQILNAHVFAGKRVRFSAWMKTRDVTRRAGLWMTITGKMNGLVRSIGGDNMEDRPVKGTTDWQRYQVVLDIAPEAQDICFGALVSGTGKVWMSHPTLEIVDASVPSTNTMK